MNIFKIKSLTDVITNSSTEIFTVYNKEAVNNIKELVNAILALNNKTSNLTFDDLFEVDFDINWGLDTSTMMDVSETLKEKGYEEEAEYIRVGNLDSDEINDYLKQHNLFEIALERLEELDNDSYEYRTVEGIIVKPKSNPKISKEKVEVAAKLLSNIDSIFEQYAIYC